MDARPSGVKFLGMVVLSVSFLLLMNYGTLYMAGGFTSSSHLERVDNIPPFAQFLPSRALDDVTYSSAKHVDGTTLLRNRAKEMADGWLQERQTGDTEISESPDFNDFSSEDGNKSSNHVLCACGYCFGLILRFRGTGQIFVEIKASNFSNQSKDNTQNEKGVYSDMYYFNMQVQGDHEMWSAVVSDQDDLLANVDPIRVTSSGDYNVSLTLIYTNKSSAYGLEKYQRKEMHCPLCQANGTCHLLLSVNVTGHDVDSGTRSGWVPTRLNEMSTNQTVLLNNDYAAYFRSWKNDKVFFSCPTCKGSQLLDKCLVKKRFMLLGDSHIHKIWNVLQTHIKRVQGNKVVKWKMRDDGHGVYHNLSPDKNFTGYVNGKVPPVFVPGKMIKGLQNGLYSKLQKQNIFDAWVFSSGHWDLRDTSVDEYLSHLEELFQMWFEFQRRTGVWLVWNGVPAYSFNRPIWGGLEKRTNVKIALADFRTKHLCMKYNITYVPFFDISFPFYSLSCDTHHYLCEGTISPIGSAQLNLLLQTICVGM